MYGANDDIIFTVKLYQWPQLQSLIEQFGRKVKREYDESVIDETGQSDDIKFDCGIDQKGEAAAFEFCADVSVTTEGRTCMEVA